MFDDRILGLDSAHVFLVSALAVAARSRVVAEVGCGRGALVDQGQPGGAWQDLRGAGRTVIGIDIEATGEQNPVIDEFRLIGADGRWPLADGSVDLAVSDFVLEHVTDPKGFVRELSRVLRPGGIFIARTISRRSLLAAAARVVPNDHHAKALERLQPGRQERDVFRTAYRMNTRQGPGTAVRRRFRAGPRPPDRSGAVLQALAPPPARRGPVRAPPAHVHVDGARRLRPPSRLSPASPGVRPFRWPPPARRGRSRPCVAR